MNALINITEELEQKYTERLKKANKNLKDFPECRDLISGRKQAYKDILEDVKRFKKEVEKWLSQNVTESE